VPDVQLSAGYAQQGTSSQAISPPNISVGVALPLPIFYQQGGEIARAAADLRAQLATRQKLEAQVAADVRSAFAAFTASRAQVERMDGRLLARARRARDLIEVQYQKGAATLLDLLDAQRTFQAVNGERLALLAGYWTAVASLEAAVAKELR
jgi:outer membrane protein, heavy metal efflux system